MTEPAPENSSEYPPVDVPETLGAIYVQLSRIYDTLMFMGHLYDAEKFAALLDQHTKGILSTPVPVIAEYYEEENNDNNQ